MTGEINRLPARGGITGKEKMMPWQLISTAPKDVAVKLGRWIPRSGTTSLMWCETVGTAFEKTWMWFKRPSAVLYLYGYTHWKPLPAPPEATE